ncbi:MAG: DNA helicase HerA-like ATPase [Limisphaerales bacterium]|jgi:DNA helicase HerA-like ATPase
MWINRPTPVTSCTEKQPISISVMSKKDEFQDHIINGYNFKSDSIVLGTAMLDGEAIPSTPVKAALRTFNRHGLIAGATGTGKTKTLQNIAERLSENGVPTLLMDIKGDLTGLAKASDGHPKIDERHKLIGTPWKASAYPVELLSLSNEPGARMRATVSEFGPVLFSKILGVNDTQSGVISLVFKYCDDNDLALLDLKDFRKALQYLNGEGKAEITGEYGSISPASVGAILRKIVEIEAQDAELFFGERSFDVDDLLRMDDNGKGFINILRLTDIQNKPKLFSTFMLSLLAEVYGAFPEVGDKAGPKLVIFIDEAHLIFKEASKALLSQIESIIKLIRSKGVGIFFVTQLPTDIPDEVLSQLGMKVQHALRAFTAKDRKAIKLTAENYPITPYYDTADALTNLGIGEALITVLNEKGIPSPLVHTLLTAPSSRMDILTLGELRELVDESTLIPKYNIDVDRESAYEILAAKMEAAKKLAEKEQAKALKEKERAKEEKERASKSRSRSSSSRTSSRRRKKSVVEEIVGSRATQTLIRELTRGLLGILSKR